MSAALVNRSISTIKTELEFLRESNVISEDFFQQVMKSLPDRYQNGQPPVDLPSKSTATPITVGATAVPPQNEKFESPSQPPPQSNAEWVEVLYTYQPQQPEDLGLTVGDKVQVLEHTSPDWWKGTCNGKTGMFPSNYVKQIESRTASPAPPPQYNAMMAPMPQQQVPQQYNNGYPVYPNNGTPFPPQQQEQPQQQQQQSQHHMPAGFKKFGSKLGNAAIFGAGATIGSDIVNSIF